MQMCWISLRRLTQLFHWLGILSVVLTYDTFSLTVGLLGCKIIRGAVSVLTFVDYFCETYASDPTSHHLIGGVHLLWLSQIEKKSFYFFQLRTSFLFMPWGSGKVQAVFLGNRHPFLRKTLQYCRIENWKYEKFCRHLFHKPLVRLSLNNIIVWRDNLRILF